MNKTVIFLFVFLILQGVSGLLDVVKQMCKHNDYSYIASIVPHHEWKQMESMAIDSCGASVINVKWVLTSSSCINRLKEVHVSSHFKLEIIAGFDLALRNFQSQLMKTFFPFNVLSSGKRSGRSGGLRHDLALVELEQPFKQGPSLQIIKIATKDLTAKCKKAETVSPVVATSGQKGGARFFRTALNLMCSSVNIGRRDSCSSTWSWMKKADDMFCGEKRSTWRKKRESGQPSLCNARAGSPVVCNNVLIGLETGCKEQGGRTGAISIILRIDTYLDFIASVLKNDSISQKGEEKNDQKKTTTAKPSSGGKGLLQEAVQKTNLLLITGAVLFVYF